MKTEAPTEVCAVCGKRERQDRMAGLNGRWLHVQCFDAGLQAQLAPVKHALRRAAHDEG